MGEEEKNFQRKLAPIASVCQRICDRFQSSSSASWKEMMWKEGETRFQSCHALCPHSSKPKKTESSRQGKFTLIKCKIFLKLIETTKVFPSVGQGTVSEKCANPVFGLSVYSGGEEEEQQNSQSGEEECSIERSAAGLLLLLVCQPPV